MTFSPSSGNFSGTDANFQKSSCPESAGILTGNRMQQQLSLLCKWTGQSFDGCILQGEVQTSRSLRDYMHCGGDPGRDGLQPASEDEEDRPKNSRSRSSMSHSLCLSGTQVCNLALYLRLQTHGYGLGEKRTDLSLQNTAFPEASKDTIHHRLYQLSSPRTPGLA